MEHGDIRVDLDLWEKSANEANGIGVVMGISEGNGTLPGLGLTLEWEREKKMGLKRLARARFCEPGWPWEGIVFFSFKIYIL